MTAELKETGEMNLQTWKIPQFFELKYIQCYLNVLQATINGYSLHIQNNYRILEDYYASYREYFQNKYPMIRILKFRFSLMRV